ncbi:MAG: 3D-(3,5/4)-trihydroxycyclohexane-1,2-dione acylhydrolase (decyclizing) [Euzebyales bacterium]|nr:3D-(3,5/4)-trihydroxycyclohexane-1,2-dione acylhydrolase (decyclizing) [Euzebyales bacterium]
METIRLTTAEALVRYLVAQRTLLVDGREAPLFPAVFAIFGHGNVTSLGEALARHRAGLPVIRGQNEQGMALAATAWAKATLRRQVPVATSSIGPGALNMVTAAGVAHANRLPLLLLSGDTFASRVPDPVLQQVEHFDDPSRTVNDAFRAVTRWWDRITKPEQLLSSLPHAVATLLDPATAGPAFLGLPQDVQAEAYDFPAAFFAPAVHQPARPRPDRDQVERAVVALRRAQRPLLIAGGGVRYSAAEGAVALFAVDHGVPVVETVAGRASLIADDEALVGPIGVTGCDHANRLAAEADVVVAVGTRLQDFTTGSWTVFADPDLQIVAVNTARYDATKHRALPVVADAREALVELEAGLEGWRAPEAWTDRARRERADFAAFVAGNVAPADGAPTYAQVVGAVNAAAGPDDYVLTAAGGLPGELNVNWRTLGTNTFDCEYGFSCMGYEIAGGWGARMARPDGEVFVLVGDGSYLMLSSDLYSSVLTAEKMIVVLCDNGGYAVIDRLQTGKGGEAFNNLLETTDVAVEATVDFAANAASMGCLAEEVADLDGLADALKRAKRADRTTVICLRTDPCAWTSGGAFWEVGIPEVSDVEAVAAARAEQDDAKRRQRAGW